MPSSAAKIPRTIWLLGLVSLFMDLSSELIHSLLPAYLVGNLGVSLLTLGLLEGLAEATAQIVKVYSGALSDYIGRRKDLLLLGYGMAALSKPLFPLASTVEWVFAARVLDRIGKGIRGAPRDALVADVAPPAIRGACFGLRQSLDTIGALLGPALAIGLMWLLQDDIGLVMWVAVVPALLAFAVLFYGVQERTQIAGSSHWRTPINRALLHRLPAAYWWVVILGGLFTLARCSEAFLLVRAQQLGLSLTWTPLVLLILAASYSLCAYPAGRCSDRYGRAPLLALALLLLIGAELLLAAANSVALVLLGAAIWGLHLGCSQGILASMIADQAPAELKGSAFGLFNLSSGLCLLLASVSAGALWHYLGAPATFLAGALLASLSLFLLLYRWRRS